MKKALLLRAIEAHFKPGVGDLISITEDVGLFYSNIAQRHLCEVEYKLYINCGAAYHIGNFRTFDMMDKFVREKILHEKKPECPKGVDALLEKGGL